MQVTIASLFLLGCLFTLCNGYLPYFPVRRPQDFDRSRYEESTRVDPTVYSGYRAPNVPEQTSYYATPFAQYYYQPYTYPTYTNYYYQPPTSYPTTYVDEYNNLKAKVAEEAARLLKLRHFRENLEVTQRRNYDDNLVQLLTRSLKSLKTTKYFGTKYHLQQLRVALLEFLFPNTQLAKDMITPANSTEAPVAPAAP